MPDRRRVTVARAACGSPDVPGVIRNRPARPEVPTGMSASSDAIGLGSVWGSRLTGWVLLLGLYLGAFTIPTDRSLAGGLARMAFCSGRSHGCRR